MNKLPNTTSSTIASNASVTIDYPKPDAVIGDKMFEMKGKIGESIGTVNITTNNGTAESVIAENGIWDYRPVNGWSEGQSHVKAQIVNSKKSAEVTFNVDTVAPQIIKDTLSVERKEDIIPTTLFGIGVKDAPSQVSLVIGSTSNQMKLEGTTYKVSVPTKTIEDAENVKIIATDLAGNYSILKISDNVLGKSATNAEKPKATGFFGTLDLGKFTTNFNRFMIVAIIILLVIDTWYLIRLNIMGTRGKSLLPMAMWVLILGVGLLAGRSGVIV